MKRISILSVLLILLSGTLFAAGARLVTVRGRVSVRQYAGAPWVRARRGMYLRKGAVISTGYAAAALLRITPGWTMVRVNQFTTMSIARLSGKGRTVRTALKLRIGTVRAVVKSTRKIRHRFRISTPVATASVRGTIPEVSHFPGQGTVISYLKGSGYVISKKGRMQLLKRGQFSRATARGVTSPFQEAQLKNMAGTIQQHLTPGERAILSGGPRWIAGIGPRDGRQLMGNLRQRVLMILNGAYDPKPF